MFYLSKFDLCFAEPCFVPHGNCFQVYHHEVTSLLFFFFPEVMQCLLCKSQMTFERMDIVVVLCSVIFIFSFFFFSFAVDYAIPPKNESLIQAYMKYRKLADGKVCCDYGLHVGISYWSKSVKHEMPDLCKLYSVKYCMIKNNYT